MPRGFFLFLGKNAEFPFIARVRKTMIYQAQEKGCGYAAVKMLLEHNGVKRAEELEEPLITGQAPSLGELIAYAKKNGLLLGGYQFLEPSGLRQCAYFPLCLLIEEEGVEHMVFVKGKTKKCYLVCDPARGRRKMNFEELESVSKGVYLRQLSFEQAAERSYMRQKPSLLGRSSFLLLFPLVEMIFALGGISCLRQGGSFPLFIIFALGYLVSLVGRSWVLLNEMKAFDKRYSACCIDSKSERRKELLQHYCAYKKASLMSKICLSEDLIAFTFLFFLLAINDPFFGLLSLAPVLFSCLEKVLFEDSKRKEEEEICAMERDFVQKKGNMEEKKAKLDGLFLSSYSFAEKISCMKIIEISLCAFSSSLCLLWGSVSSNRFLFCLFSSMYLLHQLESLYKDADMVEEEKRERPYFLLHFKSAIVSQQKGQNGTMSP